MWLRLRLIIAPIIILFVIIAILPHAYVFFLALRSIGRPLKGPVLNWIELNSKHDYECWIAKSLLFL